MTDILSNTDSLFTKNDMIMTDKGYYANMPMLHTIGGGGGHKSEEAKDKVSNNYKNLAIPALYLYTINSNCSKEEDNIDNENIQDEIMSDDLYNKLISLAEMKPIINKKYTKNKKLIKKNKAKKTRRNK